VYLPSQLERTPTTLLLMVDRVKGGRVCTPHPHKGWADFTIMLECTPESQRECPPLHGSIETQSEAQSCICLLISEYTA
jgi:hypothetical protein